MTYANGQLYYTLSGDNTLLPLVQPGLRHRRRDHLHGPVLGRLRRRRRMFVDSAWLYVASASQGTCPGWPSPGPGHRLLGGRQLAHLRRDRLAQPRPVHRLTPSDRHSGWPGSLRPRPPAVIEARGRTGWPGARCRRPTYRACDSFHMPLRALFRNPRQGTSPVTTAPRERDPSGRPAGHDAGALRPLGGDRSGRRPPRCGGVLRTLGASAAALGSAVAPAFFSGGLWAAAEGRRHRTARRAMAAALAVYFVRSSSLVRSSCCFYGAPCGSTGWFRGGRPRRHPGLAGGGDPRHRRSRQPVCDGGHRPHPPSENHR